MRGSHFWKSWCWRPKIFLMGESSTNEWFAIGGTHTRKVFRLVTIKNCLLWGLSVWKRGTFLAPELLHCYRLNDVGSVLNVANMHLLCFIKIHGIELFEVLQKSFVTTLPEILLYWTTEAVGPNLCTDFDPAIQSGSAHKIFSLWSSYNIFFKILRYTSSENTVIKNFSSTLENIANRLTN